MENIIFTVSLLFCMSHAVSDSHFILRRDAAGNCEPKIDERGCRCRYKGLCEDPGDRGKCTCCFKELYEGPKSNCLQKNFCTSNPCRNSATCQPMLGSYFCTCRAADYHGRNCEKGGVQGKRVSQPQVYFYSVIAYNEVFSFFFTIDDYFGDNFAFSFTIGGVTIEGNSALLEEGLLKNTRLADQSLFKTQLPGGLKKIFYFISSFPKKKDKDKYTVGITVEVKNTEEVQFSADYNVYVVPEAGTECCPVIEMDGCGEGNVNMVKMQRGKVYSIRSTISRPCGETAHIFWQLCSIDRDVPFPLVEIFKENTFKSSRKKPNCKILNYHETEFKIDAYSLVYGVYAFITNAAVTKCKLTPGNMCWFSVVADSIIAKLEGGSARVASAGFELVMDASSSTDPNEQLGNNAHLVYKWTCLPENEELCSSVSKQKGSKLRLQALEGNYTFTVKVSVDESKAPTIGTYPEKTLPGPGTATQVVTVIKMVTGLSIRCVKNCDRQMNSQEVLYLKVTCNTYCNGSEGDNYYKWSVEGVGLNEKDTDLGINSDKLIVREKFFSPGSRYTVFVTGGHSGRAEFVVVVKRSLQTELGDKGCVVSPKEGVSGIDYFNCKCDFPEESLGLPLRFELFQAPDLAKPQTEIMISYSLRPEMNDILLAAGTEANNYATNIFVRVEDHVGEFVKKHIATVVVKPVTEAPNFVNISETVRKLIAGDDGRPSLEDYISSGDMTGAVNLVSLTTVALQSSNLTDKEVWQWKQKFLDAIDKIPIYQDTPLRQVIAVLCFMFEAGSKKQQPIPQKSVFLASDILEKISRQLCLEINDSYVEFEVSTEELLNISKMMLETSCVLLSAMSVTMNNLTTGNVSSTTTTSSPLLPEDDMDGPDYPSYYELDPEYVLSVKMFKVASAKVMTSIQNIGKAIMHRLGEEQSAKLLEADSMKSWIKVDKPSNLQDQLLGTGDTSQHVKISKVLAQAMERKSEYIGIQVTTMQENPFVWDKEESVNTALIEIEIYDETISETPEITTPIDLYVSTADNVSSEAVEGQVSVPLKAAHDKELLDDCIAVHKIEAKKGQTPYLKFEPFQQPLYKIQIVVTEEVRPSVDLFSEHSQSVPHGGNLTVFVEGVSIHERSWFYIGILPHPETLENASLLMAGASNLTINYTFHMKIIKCLSWNKTSVRWSSDGCQYGPETAPEELHCQCLHLSTFSGSLLAASAIEDIFHQISILLFTEENFIILSFAGSFLAVFFFLLIWTKWADNRDDNQRVVTVLEDNLPKGSYAYLVGVFTGWKWNAGTTANVGIQLIGESCRGSVHILKDRTRRVHARNSDSWFVIFGTKDLGNLQYLHLWHDNSGHSAPWFCERIIVRDIAKDITWVFAVQRWLSLVHSPSKIFCTVRPRNEGEEPNKATLFKNNARLGLQEQHIWANIFVRHPRSTYSRTARLTTSLAVIMSTMLVSLCLCGIPRGSSTDQIDEASFHFPTRETALTITASFILAPLHFILVVFFRKTVPGVIRHSQNARAILVTPSDKKESPLWWHKIVNFIALEPLIEAPRLRRSESGKLKQDLKASRYWFPAWFIFVPWTLCAVVIIVSAALLVIFGLAYASVRSEMWIVATFMFLMISAVILQPLKVMILSLIVTFLFKSEPSSVQEVDVLFLDERDAVVDRKRLLELRTQQMYKPLKTQEILKLGRRERTRLRLAELFRDICLFLFYIITLYWLVLNTQDDLAFFSTDGLRKSIIFADDFHSLASGVDINTYMSEMFLPAVHKGEWYNEKKIEAPAVTSLYDTRLLGIARLRQLRVRNESCEISPVLNQLIRRCNVEFSLANEDRAHYGIGWEAFEGAAYRETRASAPWLYRSLWQSGTLPVRGVFSTYPGGGYITTLGRTLENSLLIWDFLMEQKWLDPLTRALFIEFTLYNANRNIFNIVNLLVEIDSTGAIHTTEDIKSMNLLVHFEDLGPMILIALILWLLILSLFTLLQLSRIGRISFRLYLRSWWNVIDLVILAMAVAIIALYLLRSRYVSALVKQLQEADQNEFVNFIWASFWQEQLRYFIAALVCVSTARLWKLLRFQQQFRAFEHVLVHASKTLVFLTCMMVVIVIGFAIFAHMYIGHTNELFSNFLFAFSAMVMYGIGYSEVNVEEFVKQDAFIGSVFVGTFWMVYIIYLLNIFITVINILYEKNKKEEGFFQADYTMLDYLREEIRYMCKRRRHSPKSIRRATVKEMYPQYFEDGNETKEERLRAGADTRAKPVHCAPAIAVPKPDEIRNENSQEITAFRLKGMTFLAVGAIRKQDKKVDAMTALVLDCALDEKGEEAFYSGLDEEKEKLVPNEKLLQMESVVNKIGAEQYAAHTMKEYEDIENREDEIEDEITSLDDVGHLDVLKCQMIKILKIISDWDTPDKSKRQRKIKKRKKRDESENEEESLKKADQGNVLPDLASNGRMEPISADAKQSEEAAPLGVAALPVVVPPSVSDRNIYKTDFCGLFPLKIDLSANGQESSHAAFSMTQATHDPFRPSANQITTLRRTCRRPARVSEDRTAVRTVPPYLDDYSASDTNQSSQNGTASFQRQPCTHRRRNITPERRDPNRNPNQDNSLPPDFCARCSFLKLSDDEKLLLMQQQQQQFGTNVSQPVSREQTTDIEQVRRVLFMLLNSYLYPHEPLSSLCWRCQRPTGLRDMDHDRRARQQDVRSYENFGMVQNRSFENQYPVSNRTGIDKLTHVATDTLQNTRTGKQGVYHRVFPVHHVSRRPPTLHGKCLWRRRDERHMRQFFAAPRASNQFYSSDWQHLAPQEQEVSGSQNDPSLQIDFHIHSYRGRNETRLSQRGCRQRRFRRL